MASALTVGVLRVLLTGNSAQFEQMLRDSSKAAKQWSKDLRSIGSQATAVGSTLTKAITLPIAGAVAASSKAFIDFESSFAGIRKTVNATEQEFAKLATGMRDLSKTIPINVNELNRIGEAAGQLGIKTENILGFTDVMAKLGVTTNLSSDQAASALARLANITQMPQSQFDRLGSTIVGLGNTLATTESEIVDFGLRIAGAGKIAGLNEHQILAIGAAMSSVGVQAEAGGTAVQKVLNAMTESVASGGPMLEEFARTAGMTAEEFQRAFRQDAAGAFTAFVQGLGQQGDQAFQTLDNLKLGNERVIRAFLSLAGASDLLTRALGTASTEWERNTALTEEARRRFETIESRLTLLWNRLKDVGITLGNALKPSIEVAIGALDKLIPLLESGAKWFSELPSGVQFAAVALAGIAAAAGPVLLVFGQMAMGASTLVGLLGSTGLAAAAGTLAAALGPALLTGAVLGAMVAFDQLEQSTRKALDRAREGEATWGDVPDLLMNAVSRGLNPFGAAWRDITRFINEATTAWDIFMGRAVKPPPMPPPPPKLTAEAFVAPGVPENLDAIYRQLDQSQRKVTKSAKELKAEQKAAERAMREANKAADALNKEQDRQRQILMDLGAVTEDVVASALAPLVEKLNLAARAGDRQLRIALTKLHPEFEKLSEMARAAGLNIDFARQTFDQFAEAAGIATLESKNFTAQMALVPAPIAETNRETLAVIDAARRANEEQRKLAEAFSFFGLKSREELQKTADAARLHYQRIVESGIATEEQIRDAFNRMQEAAAKAAGRTATVWTEMLPRIKGIVENIRDAVNGSFAQMLLGAKGFKDGFLDIWESIKAGIAQILTSILQDFTNRFLGGLINAMLGRRGAFQSAFSGMFSGALPGLGIPGIGGGAGAGTGIGSVIGAGPGIAPVGGLPGGAAGAVPWWSTTLGSGLLAGGAGAGAGFLVGSQSGNRFGGAGAGFGTGFATGMMLGGPPGALIGGGIGALVGWWAAKRANKQANDIRDEFIAQFGPQGTGVGSGFHNLASRLTEAGHGPGGGELFQRLIKANDPGELREAIDAVVKALAEYEARTQSASQAEAEHQKEIGQTTDAYAQQRRELEAQLDDVNARLATLGDTADTEMRQAVEQQKDAIQRQLHLLEAASADALRNVAHTAEETGDITLEEARRVRDELAGIFTNRAFTIPVNFKLPNKPPDFRSAMPLPVGEALPRFARGTPNLEPLNFGRGTLAILDGLETVVPAGKEAEFAARHGGGRTAPAVVFQPGSVIVNGEVSEAERVRIVRLAAQMVPGVVAEGGRTLDEWARMTRHLAKA